MIQSDYPLSFVPISPYENNNILWFISASTNISEYRRLSKTCCYRCQVHVTQWNEIYINSLFPKEKPWVYFINDLLANSFTFYDNRSGSIVVDFYIVVAVQVTSDAQTDISISIVGLLSGSLNLTYANQAYTVETISITDSTGQNTSKTFLAHSIQFQ